MGQGVTIARKNEEQSLLAVTGRWLKADRMQLLRVQAARSSMSGRAVVAPAKSPRMKKSEERMASCWMSRREVLREPSKLPGAAPHALYVEHHGHSFKVFLPSDEARSGHGRRNACLRDCSADFLLFCILVHLNPSQVMAIQARSLGT